MAGCPIDKKRLRKVQKIEARNEREPCDVGSRGPLKGPGGDQGQSPWLGSRGRSPLEAPVHFNADTAFPTQTYIRQIVKGCGMGQWLVIVSPCFRENVVATCKIGSFFMCNLVNLLQKSVIVFFFGNQISKWRSFEKRALFDLLFTFFSHQGKVTKIPSAHISLTYIHAFCSPYWLFCLTNLKKNTNLSCTVSLWYESWCWFLFAPFWNNQ